MLRFKRKYLFYGPLYPIVWFKNNCLYASTIYCSRVVPRLAQYLLHRFVQNLTKPVFKVLIDAKLVIQNFQKSTTRFVLKSKFLAEVVVFFFILRHNIKIRIEMQTTKIV